MRSSSSEISNGLRMKSLHPDRKHILSLLGSPLIAKIGTDLVFSSRRTLVTTAKPLMSGRPRSRRIKSGNSCLITSNALVPDPA